MLCFESRRATARSERKEKRGGGREGGMKGGGERSLYRAGALLHKTIRNNRGGITTARSASGMDRADRIDSSAGTLRLDLAALHSPLSVRSTRREGVEAPFIFLLFSFFGPPPSISDNRPSPAARGRGIARIPDRIPNAAPYATDAGSFYGTPGCVSL